MAVSALPVLTDSNVRCAPVLETTASRLTPAYFQTVSEAFTSVLDAMWWAAVTLTTVGYGDITPVTPIGRLFTVLMLFVALGIIAIPTGLVASALSAIRETEASAAAEDREAARPSATSRD